MANKNGRSTKLTLAIKEAILDGIKKGLTPKAACECVGISYSSLYNWKKIASLTNDEIALLYAELIVYIKKCKWT